MINYPVHPYGKLQILEAKITSGQIKVNIQPYEMLNYYPYTTIQLNPTNKYFRATKLHFQEVSSLHRENECFNQGELACLPPTNSTAALDDSSIKSLKNRALSHNKIRHHHTRISGEMIARRIFHP